MFDIKSRYEREKEKEILRLKHEKEMYELKKQYRTETITATKKMYQYSKILTTAILILTMLFNSFFYFFLVPFSGVLSMTDKAFETVGTILLAWNAGTILFFIGYFGKALFETKWESETSTGKVKNKFEKVATKVSETIENITNSGIGENPEE